MTKLETETDVETHVETEKENKVKTETPEDDEYCLPKNFPPGSDEISKAVFKDKRISKIICNALLGKEVDSTYGEAYMSSPNEFLNRSACDVLYLAEYIDENYPPILIEFQHTVDDKFMTRVINYATLIWKNHKVYPIILIFGIDTVREYLLKDLKSEENRQFMLEFDSKDCVENFSAKKEAFITEHRIIYGYVETLKSIKKENYTDKEEIMKRIENYVEKMNVKYIPASHVKINSGVFAELPQFVDRFKRDPESDSSKENIKWGECFEKGYEERPEIFKNITSIPHLKEVWNCHNKNKSTKKVTDDKKTVKKIDEVNDKLGKMDINKK